MNTGHVPGLVPTPFEGLADLVPRADVAFVTDERLAGLPRVRSVLDTLGDVVEIVMPLGEPTTRTVDTVARRLEIEGSTTVVAFGGGSVLDTVKLAALVAVEGGEVTSHLETARSSSGTTLDVVAIPTTSGSGAEVTRTAVLAHGRRKTWAWNDALRPGTVLVDSTLTHGLPKLGTVSTGLDALVHAIEASTARAADPQAIESGGAAVATILATLPVVVADGDDAAARAEMLDASICAGYAIDRAGTGIGHAVGHALGSIITIPHGLGVAFGMSACLEWGGDAHRPIDPDGDLPERIDSLLETIGFWHHLAPWAKQPLDPIGFHRELAQPAHRPMCLNNARPADGDDLVEVAALVSNTWNARFA